jgi:transposase
MQRAEIITVERHRRWSLSEKQDSSPRRSSRERVSARLRSATACIQTSSLRGGKAARDGRLVEDGSVEFAPAVIASNLPERVALPPADPPLSGRMEIVLDNGRRVIVDTSVRASALARVIKVLDRR